MDRRKFIKTSCTLCAVVAAGLPISMIASCTSLTIYKTVVSENKIKVPLTAFVTGDFILVRPRDYEFDIAARKLANGAYEALLLRCTHEDNQLISTGNGFVCNLHGSRFDSEGTVVKGPAVRPLQKFRTEIVSGDLIIYST